MRIRRNLSNKLFYNRYRYRVNVQSYAVFKPETCCPHRTVTNNVMPLDKSRLSLFDSDAKLRCNRVRWGASTVFFNDLSLADNLANTKDLLVYNLTERVIEVEYED